MSSNSYSDKELVSALNEGDRAAYKYIYLTYYNDLCKYISSYTNSPQAAEDIVQNVLLKLWEKRTDLKIHTSFKNYLFRSAYHTFIDNYRKKKKINEKLETIRHHALNEIIEEHSSLKEERLVALRKAIEELPPKCKNIFVLSKFEGYKYKEIAEILGISVNTVENQIGKAFKVLREKILNTKPLNFFLSFFENKFS
ncbi:RNA polymerase sigma factor [Seonamhaeicola sp.]|uniref:RNA polymerase sigma factor n=1 Tax=Seonamhaeicola sp. TaxID=1912245 RepID=UPI00260B06AA|nr:RNA polymerase sigma factor [Seonamhaeicola sp.]